LTTQIGSHYRRQPDTFQTIIPQFGRQPGKAIKRDAVTADGGTEIGIEGL